MTRAKSRKIGFGLVLVAGLGALILFLVPMYRNDIKALEGFIVSYDSFDKAMPSGAGDGTQGGIDPAREAVADLRAKASFRISSLIRNDAELMRHAREVADLAQREFESIRLGQEAGILQEKRKAAYARFMALAGTNGRAKNRTKGDDHGS